MAILYSSKNHFSPFSGLRYVVTNVPRKRRHNLLIYRSKFLIRRNDRTNIWSGFVQCWRIHFTFRILRRLMPSYRPLHHFRVTKKIEAKNEPFTQHYH